MPRMVALRSLLLTGFLVTICNAADPGQCLPADPLVKTLRHHKDGNLYCLWFLGIPTVSVTTVAVSTPSPVTVSSTTVSTIYTTNVVTTTITAREIQTTTVADPGTYTPFCSVAGAAPRQQKRANDPYRIQQLSAYPKSQISSACSCFNYPPVTTAITVSSTAATATSTEIATLVTTVQKDQSISQTTTSTNTVTVTSYATVLPTKGSTYAYSLPLGGSRNLDVYPATNPGDGTSHLFDCKNSYAYVMREGTFIQGPCNGFNDCVDLAERFNTAKGSKYYYAAALMAPPPGVFSPPGQPAPVSCMLRTTPVVFKAGLNSCGTSLFYWTLGVINGNY